MISNPIEATRRACQAVRRGTGYRSGLEVAVAEQLEAHGIAAEYETARLPYTETHVYIPDFILPNGIVLEVKGMFDSEDRSKMIKVKNQYPDLDIRFIFDNPKTRLNRGSKTTYGGWCDKQGFKYAKQEIPIEWLY